MFLSAKNRADEISYGCLVIYDQNGCAFICDGLFLTSRRVLLGYGQKHAEGAAAPPRAVQGNGSLLRSQDAGDCGQPQPSSREFGGKERIEDPGFLFFR